jgi:cytochrome c
MKLRIAAVALVLAVTVVVLGSMPSLRGQENAGADALKKAVETGNALFRANDFGTISRSCAKCHENPRKPNMNLDKRVGDYPKWDRGHGKVITLGQKIQQMHRKMLKGEELPLGSEKLVAVEAYLMSLSRQTD